MSEAQKNEMIAVTEKRELPLQLSAEKAQKIKDMALAIFKKLDNTFEVQVVPGLRKEEVERETVKAQIRLMEREIKRAGFRIGYIQEDTRDDALPMDATEESFRHLDPSTKDTSSMVRSIRKAWKVSRLAWELLDKRCRYTLAYATRRPREGGPKGYALITLAVRSFSDPVDALKGRFFALERMYRAVLKVVPEVDKVQGLRNRKLKDEEVLPDPFSPNTNYFGAYLYPNITFHYVYQEYYLSPYSNGTSGLEGFCAAAKKFLKEIFKEELYNLMQTAFSLIERERKHIYGIKDEEAGA